MSGKQAAPAAGRAGGKSDPAPAQRKTAEETLQGEVPEKLPLQAARTLPEKARAAGALQRCVGNRRTAQLLQAAAPPGGLPQQLKHGVEALSGVAMDDVRVHHNSAKPAQLNALAYAQGTDIHLAPGQDKHLPHEAWHAAQQKQGRVKHSAQMAGHPVNTDPTLEREADTMGARAAAYSGASGGIGAAATEIGTAALGGTVVQMTTNIFYKEGKLKWKTKEVGGTTKEQDVGLDTQAYIDPGNSKTGERTGTAPDGTIYKNGGGGLYKANNDGNSLTQGHLLNANLGSSLFHVGSLSSSFPATR